MYKLRFLLASTLIFAIPGSASGTDLNSIDLRAIECSSKGRAQDKTYNPDVPEIDELLSAGIDGLAYLVNHVGSERALHGGPWCLGFIRNEGQVAATILDGFFTDETWHKRSLPELCDQAYTPREFTASERERFWRSMMDRYSDRLQWNESGRYYYVDGVSLCVIEDRRQP